MALWPFNTLFLKDITDGVRSTTKQDVLNWASAQMTGGILGLFLSTEIEDDDHYKQLKTRLGPNRSKWPKKVSEWADTAAELTPEQFKAVNCKAGAPDQRQRKRIILAIYELAHKTHIPGRHEKDKSPEESNWRSQMCLRLLLTCLVDYEENPDMSGWICGRVLKFDSPGKGAPQPRRPVMAKSPSTRRYRHGYGLQDQTHTDTPRKITSERNNRPPPSYTDAASTSRAPSYGSRDSSPLFVSSDESDHEAEQATEHDARRATKTTIDREKEDQPAQVGNQDIPHYEATIESLQRELAATKRKLEETTDTLKQERKKYKKDVKELKGRVQQLEDAAGV